MSSEDSYYAVRFFFRSQDLYDFLVFKVAVDWMAASCAEEVLLHKCRDVVVYASAFFAGHKF